MSLKLLEILLEEIDDRITTLVAGDLPSARLLSIQLNRMARRLDKMIAEKSRQPMPGEEPLPFGR